MKNLITLAILILCIQFAAISSPYTSPNGSDQSQIRSNLYIVAPDGSTVLMDGTLTQYSSSYSNALDAMDARKMSNSSENWGMLRNNAVYVIERRHTIEGSDSIFFKMWNMRIITYRVEFITTNLNSPGRKGVLEDKYLKTSTPIDLNGTTYVDFNVTSDPASKATDRFRIIFSDDFPEATPMPHFTAIGAFEINNEISINWKSEGQNKLMYFDIERSKDKINFVTLSNTLAYNTIKDYHWVDTNPEDGDNYYRIRSIANDGTISYSNIVKITNSNERTGLTIYPNPVSANNFNLHIVNQKAGTYEIKLINSSGQLFMAKKIQYAGGSSIEKLTPTQNIPAGAYYVEIMTPEKIRKVINVIF